MRPLCLAILSALALTGLAGCGSPANVAGNYAINVTNGTNACAFPNWMVGTTASNIMLTITQDSSTITGNVGGVTGTALQLTLGDHVLHGDVSGNDIDLTLNGTRAATQGMCTYTVILDAHATLVGDFLSNGTLTYHLATNHSPDCGALETCKTLQSFNGSRPPTGS